MTGVGVAVRRLRRGGVVAHGQRRGSPWVLGVALILCAGSAGAHAFPERSDPSTGAVVRAAPARVQIWFDGDIEPAFSQIQVTTVRGQRVDRGDTAVDPGNHRLLRVTLSALVPGVYRVSWSVLAVDGHRSRGRYTFTLKRPE